MHTDTPTGLTFRALTRPDAEALVSWRYPAPYDIYNFDTGAPVDVVDSILAPEHNYFAVLNRDEGLLRSAVSGLMRRSPAATTHAIPSTWEEDCVPTSPVEVWGAT